MSEERSLRDEIDAALEGMSLQELDLPVPSRKADGPAGGDHSRLSRGTVVGVNQDDVIVELGPRVQGVISIAEFEPPPKVGDVFDFTIVGREDDLWLLSRREAVTLSALEDLAPGVHVKAKVTGQNTGGLELRFSGVAGFMPASHVDVARIEDLSTFLGQHVVCEVLEIDRGKKRLLLSRRNVLQKELDLARSEMVSSLSVGDVVHGKVTRVESFGAFVDIKNGVEGLVHVSNIARERVNDAKDVLKVGQEVHAKVLEIKEGGKRIGLGLKQLLPDPWDDAEERYQTDQIVQARVVKAMEFGLFLELEPGLEGLLHVSQMGEAGRRGGRRKDGPAAGSMLAVRIVSIDRAQRRIALSRLDTHGALIGSEEAAGAAEIDDVLKSGREQLGTNLGNLFKKALGGE